MPLLLQIAIGGAIGAALRYLMGARVSRMAGHAFPWGTLSVNVLGCLLMGLLAGFLLRRADTRLHHLAPFLMTGVLGGFTTFSAFSLETYLLVERGRPALALAYVGGSVAAGLGAFVAGFWLARGLGAA